MISERQYSKLLSNELMAYMLEGRLGNIAEINKRLQDALGSKSFSIYKYIPQARKSLFLNELFNDQLDDIYFDIETIQEELFQLFNDSLRRLNYADLYHKANTYELDKLEATLKSILFTFRDADYYFLGAFDSFTDYSKTNRDLSTENIIDLKEECLALPNGSSGTKRISSSHLVDVSTWQVSIIKPEESLVYNSKQVESTNFGDIFIDTINGWVYEVTTTEPVECNVQFKFPLAAPASEEAEVLVNKFSVTPSTPNQTAAITISTDDVNYKKLEGYEAGVFMKDQKKEYSMEILTELVQFVNISLTKKDYDEEISGPNDEKLFVYRFGLKGFSAYTIGRISSATYVSKPFSFSGNEQEISRVSLDANMTIPEGTSVSWSVASAADGKVLGNFIPIAPVDYNNDVGANQIVKFSTTQSNDLRFDSSASQFTTYGEFRGAQFYKLNKALENIPIFGSASLYRGYKVWSRQKDAAISTEEVRDNYVSFSKTDIEKLYTLSTEVPVFRVETVSTLSQVKLIVAKDVYYISGKHDLKPKANEQKTKADAAPTYAVYEVLHLTDQPTKQFQITANANKIKLPHDSFIIRGAEAPTITDNVSRLTYQEGRDYVIETTEVEGIIRPTGYIIIVPTTQNGNIDTSQQPLLDITLKLDPDVTYKVSAILGKEITLNNMSAKPGDTFKITYRYVPTSPNDILKASVRVKDSISTTKKIRYYAEGSDYIIDALSGSIQRLPNGNIPSDGEVFVDYRYKTADDGIETFLTWCYVSETGGVQINFDLDLNTKKNLLVADKTVGERLYISSQDGLVDITDSVTTPILGPGWVQFIVRSKNPDANKIASGKGNLIDQVIQARDINKKRIFVDSGKYFKDILAMRQPLIQKTLSALKNNTLVKDHGYFAVDYITDPKNPTIVLNYNPGTTDELYLKIPQEENSVDPLPKTYYESFKLSWQSKVPSDTTGNSVVVQCQLNREAGIDPGITPKVYSYSIRASK